MFKWSFTLIDNNWLVFFFYRIMVPKSTSNQSSLTDVYYTPLLQVYWAKCFIDKILENIHCFKDAVWTKHLRLLAPFWMIHKKRCQRVITYNHYIRYRRLFKQPTAADDESVKKRKGLITKRNPDMSGHETESLLIISSEEMLNAYPNE